jgi:CheY-like chemotaxis protein
MGARILVADDSVTIQKVVELTFSKEDFVLTQARSGGEAIRKAKEIRPDLVLLDLVMPDMNGYDVCAALRADPALQSVPVILLVGTFESFDQQRGMQAGANDFVTKPFESQVLIGKVKQLLFAKAMETGKLAASGKRPTDAVTVKIPSAASPPSMVPPSLEAVPPPERAIPPTPTAVPPQDELWQLLGGSPEPAPAAVASTEQVDLSKGDAMSFDAHPAEPEGPSLDLSALDLESLPAETVSAADAMDVLPLPESLSLDDLLAAGAETPTGAESGESVAEPKAVPEPVFELSATDAPPLPMVEVGQGEAPPLSVEDLLGPAVAEAAPADTLTMDLPELVVPGRDAVRPATTETELPQPAVGERVGHPLGDTTVAAAEPVTQEAAPSGPPDFLQPIEGAGESSTLAGAGASVLSSGMPLVREGERGVEPAAAPLTAGPAEAQPITPATVLPSEMAAMREAVTERVAHELKRELSEKLLDRFEKIVWEVVPDLAEILITKEIERIRRLAEEEKSS